MTGDQIGSNFIVSIADLERRRRPPKRRVCAHDGCDTILSRYNPSTYCAAHEPEPEVFRHEGYSFRVCRCGDVFQVHDGGGSRLCPACKRRVVSEEARRAERRRRTKSTRKDGRLDAVQKAQRRETVDELARRLWDAP